MGAKQSSPAANGRTRAYSGSDLPSGTSSSNGSGRTAAMRYHAHGTSGATSSSSSSAAVASIGTRTRSVGGGTGGSGARPQSSINIPNSGPYSSQESGNSTPEENGGERERSTGTPRLLIGSLPAHLSPHLFGEDVLAKDTGECAICLEDLVQGDTIARLPCLCIYHKGCIDEWFEVNRSCPEHPSD
ncbi:E3 ubiquitin-protein ligase znrf2 isoform X3 [Ctenopharyngodon idella]|uniref:E3 ubiquitin-protein ligase znrf2 isoform X3 n=1 Tax=Ctenopharyngodon idella TaxID=7959 RepID=UPI00222E15BC|nr:E3 ubiquitin-protein ligase znrf2 isoform X3 [Ctenopharyngodon idella]